MRRGLTAVPVAFLLALAAPGDARADPQGWWGVFGDFTAGAVISGVYRDYRNPPPRYDPRYSGSEYGPSYYGGTRYRYPPAGDPKVYRQNPNYRHWTEF